MNTGNTLETLSIELEILVRVKSLKVCIDGLARYALNGTNQTSK